MSLVCVGVDVVRMFMSAHADETSWWVGVDAGVVYCLLV